MRPLSYLPVVVVVIVVGEIIAVHCEAVGVQACAVGERGCGLDGDVGSVGEGDGAGGEVEVSRVNNLLAREQIVQSAGVSLSGLVVDNVEHWFLLRGCVFLFGSIVACCGVLCMVFLCLVGHALGVVLVMLVKRMWAFEGGCALLGKRNGMSVGKQAEGRSSLANLRPYPRVRPRVYPRAPGCLLVG